MTPLISIIVITLDGSIFLKQCLRSLAGQSYKNIELILINNGPNNVGAKVIPKGISQAKIINTGRNLGFAKAANKGAREAAGSYIFFLNDDAYVTESTIGGLVSFIQKGSDIFAVQPKVLEIGTNLLDSGGYFFTISGFFYYPNRYKKDLFSDTREVFGGAGSALMVDKRKFFEVGAFDDDFFFYQEDADLCWRARVAGYKIYCIGNCHVYHKIGRSASKIKHHKILFHSFKNRIMLLVKNLQNPYLVVVLMFHLTLIIIIGFLYLFALRMNNFLGVWAAILWNVVNLNKLIKKRRLVQKKRMVSDSLLLKKFMKFPQPFDFAISGWKIFLRW